MNDTTATPTLDGVDTVVDLVIAIALPTAVGYAVVGARRLLRWRAQRRPPLPAEPIERLGADLRRLHAQLEAVENGYELPGKGLRCRAVRAAYVDALTAACIRLDVAPPAATGGGAVPRADIYRAEAALRGCGLDVRAILAS